MCMSLHVNRVITNIWRTKLIENYYRNTKNHQKDSIQQLIGADAELLSQLLLEARGILQKRGRKDCRSQRGQGHHKKTYRIN